MITLHTVDLLCLLLFLLLFHLKQYLYNFLFDTNTVEYCNMHICQTQKLLESYDYNIISYVMVINFF